jgi:hypothetical protein
MSGTPSRKKRPVEKNRSEKLFVRMSLSEITELKKNADKYSSGNVSKWIRDRATKPALDISIKMQNEIDGGFDEK